MNVLPFQSAAPLSPNPLAAAAAVNSVRWASLPVACALEAGGDEAEALRRGLADHTSGVDLLLERLDACDARQRVTLAEAGYLERLQRCQDAALPAGEAGTAVVALVASLAGRQA